jgi:hypothetical protein
VRSRKQNVELIGKMGVNAERRLKFGESEENYEISVVEAGGGWAECDSLGDVVVMGSSAVTGIGAKSRLCQRISRTTFSEGSSRGWIGGSRCLVLMSCGKKKRSPGCWPA